nr:MarC family protein [Psychromonas ossibalaenae]
MFVFGEKLVKALGPSVLNVISRMMGLILAVIGTQMFIEGLDQVVKALAV